MFRVNNKVFVVNFEHISHVVLATFNSEHVIAGWETKTFLGKTRRLFFFSR